MRARGLHHACEARIEMRLLLPHDDSITPPCEECAAKATAALEDWLRAVGSADCHVVGPW